jgi:hypothetical protein
MLPELAGVQACRYANEQTTHQAKHDRLVNRCSQLCFSFSASCSKLELPSKDDGSSPASASASASAPYGLRPRRYFVEFVVFACACALPPVLYVEYDAGNVGNDESDVNDEFEREGVCNCDCNCDCDCDCGCDPEPFGRERRSSTGEPGVDGAGEKTPTPERVRVCSSCGLKK